jgi:hypothetical protein
MFLRGHRGTGGGFCLPVQKGDPMTDAKKPADELISLTARVDQGRYEWLKTHGAKEGLCLEDIVIKALDEYRKTVEAKEQP